VRLSWLNDEKKGSNNGDAGGEQRGLLLLLEGTLACLWLTSWIRHVSEQYN
jgi:hypothetical protein